MTPAVRPASGQTLPLVGAGRTAGVIVIGSREGGRSAAVTEPAASMPFGTKDVRSWFVGIAATHRTSAGRALAALAPLAAAVDFAYVEPDEPAAHGWMVAVRADGPGRATRVRRMAAGSAQSVPRAPARHRGDPRRRDDDARGGGVRRARGLTRNARHYRPAAGSGRRCLPQPVARWRGIR